MTSNKPWDPFYCDNDIDPADPSFYENTPNLLQHLPHEDYNVHRDYIHTFHAKVPTATSAPAPTTASVPAAHSVLCPASNTLLSPVPMDDLTSNGSVEFDAFTNGCLFENAIEDTSDQEQFFSTDDKASVDFWLNDAEYYHHESVTRCVNAERRSNAPSISATDLFDLQETNTYSVHELEFLANGYPRIYTPSVVDYENKRPYFAWQTTDIIQATFKNST